MIRNIDLKQHFPDDFFSRWIELQYMIYNNLFNFLIYLLDWVITYKNQYYYIKIVKIIKITLFYLNNKEKKTEIIL